MLRLFALLIIVGLAPSAACTAAEQRVGDRRTGSLAGQAEAPVHTDRSTTLPVMESPASHGGELLLRETFENNSMTSRGWQRDLNGPCTTLYDAALGGRALRCTFAKGHEAPYANGVEDRGPGRHAIPPVTEFTLKFKHKIVPHPGARYTWAATHGIMMMPPRDYLPRSDVGKPTPANSYGSLYFEHHQSKTDTGMMVLKFQDNKSYNCAYPVGENLVNITEDRTATDQSRLAPAPAGVVYRINSPCPLGAYNGEQSRWFALPNQPNERAHRMEVGQWYELVYYVKQNTITGGKANFDGKAWVSIRRLDSASEPFVISDHTQLMYKAGGWNKDMAWAQIFLGPWSSPNAGEAWSSNFDVYWSDVELYRGDAR
jgi:hypothetical protein